MGDQMEQRLLLLIGAFVLAMERSCPPSLVHLAKMSPAFYRALAARLKTAMQHARKLQAVLFTQMERKHQFLLQDLLLQYVTVRTQCATSSIHSVLSA